MREWYVLVDVEGVKQWSPFHGTKTSEDGTEYFECVRKQK